MTVGTIAMVFTKAFPNAKRMIITLQHGDHSCNIVLLEDGYQYITRIGGCMLLRPIRIEQSHRLFHLDACGVKETAISNLDTIGLEIEY